MLGGTQDEWTHLEVNPNHSYKKQWGSLLFCIRGTSSQTERMELKEATNPDMFMLLCSSRKGFQNIWMLLEKPQSSKCLKGHRGEKGKPKSKSFTRQMCNILEIYAINQNHPTLKIYVLKAVDNPGWNQARILPQTHFCGQMKYCMQVRKQALTPTVAFWVFPPFSTRESHLSQSNQKKTLRLLKWEKLQKRNPHLAGTNNIWEIKRRFSTLGERMKTPLNNLLCIVQCLPTQLHKSHGSSDNSHS